MAQMFCIDLEDVPYLRFDQVWNVNVSALVEVVSPYVPERIAADPYDSWPAEGPEIELASGSPVQIFFVADNGDKVSIVTTRDKLPEEITEAIVACAVEQYMSGGYYNGGEL